MSNSNKRLDLSPTSKAAFRRQKHKQTIFKLAPLAAALMAISVPASADTITWGGGTGDWYSTITPGGWAGGNVPSITDIAIINSGTVTVEGSSIVAEVIQNNDNTIGGSGNLITTTLIWGNGYQNGSGTTTVNGNTKFGSGGNLNTFQTLGNNSTPRTLNLNGNSIFQSESLRLSYGSIINNNGTFISKGNVRADTTYDNYIFGFFSAGGTNTFNNTGNFVQDAAGIRTTVNSLAFNNSGTVNIKAGTLALNSGGTSTGLFTAEAGGILDFIGGDHNLSGASITANDGIVRLSGGIITINADTVATGSGTSGLTQTGGNIGGAGSLITTVLKWVGGYQSTSYSSIPQPPVGGYQSDNGNTTVTEHAIFGDGSISIYGQGQTLGVGGTGRTLNLNGNSTFQSYTLTLNHGSAINNKGTFTSKGDVRGNIIGDNYIDNTDNYGGDSTFNNTGAFIQDASGRQTTVSVAFNNTGAVQVKSGTLQLDNLSNYDRTTQTLSGGSYHIEDGNTLAINLGNSTDRIRTNSADITLDGANARILNSNGNSNALSAFTTNTAAGSLSLLNGAGLSTGASANAGNITVGNGSSFASSGNYVQSAGSTVVHGALSAGLVDIQGGSLTGNGIITGNVTNAGLVGPGASPGTLNVLGDFTQLADGVLAIEIAGTDQGVNYDWLNISGSASLAGTLDVFFTAGYLPTAGSAYTILSYGDWDQSTFDAIQVTGLDLAQYTYSTIYSDNGLIMSIAAVPEPSTYALLLAGLGLVGRMARRRK